MDYIALAKRAYQITIKHPFLWIFGMFVVGTVGFSNIGSLNDKDRAGLHNISQAQINNYINEHWSLVCYLAGILIVLVAVCFVFAIISQGALIGTTEKLEQKEKADFHIGFKIGNKFFSRLLGLGIVYFLIIMLGTFILFTPFLMFIAGKMVVPAVIWGFFALIVFVALAISVQLVSPYASRILVLEDKSIKQSFKDANKFACKHLGKIILVYLTIAIISAIFVTCFALALILVGSILALIGVAIWLASAIAGILYVAAVGSALLIVIIMIGAAFKAFQSVLLTLAYKELKK